MRYLVKARIKPERTHDLLIAIDSGSLGQGSVAGDEFCHNMNQAWMGPDKTVHWVETCFCDEPLAEERPHWEKYFDLLSIKDAHARKNCRDLNGTEPWACCDCDCTLRLEKRLAGKGENFLETLRAKELSSHAGCKDSN